MNSDTNRIKENECAVDDFTNVQFKKTYGKIYIPCGVGEEDHGFFIHGIKEKWMSSESPVYALVYNYLIRNSRILPEDYPHYLSQKDIKDFNYQRIYRLMIIILQLLKNGQVTRTINIEYDGKQEELELAIDIINDYIIRFSRLNKIIPKKISVLKKNGGTKVNVSLDRKINGVYVENNKEINYARELWYSEKIEYELDDSSIGDLEYLLSEISPFDSFKEGQFEALTEMLNNNEHSVCIMPTGSGKSLIFYLASLLQPLPMIVLSPTEILIDDQIRNLRKFHHMDNVSHLKLTADNDFGDFNLCTSLTYLTPTTLQNRNLLVACRHMNVGIEMVKNENTGIFTEVQVAPGPALAYVVLDEIHCLSNWGHDFRPEYLMLSKNLNKFFSNVNFLGFTATANYTVVEDIQKQLDIPQDNIISPITFDKYNISYDFRAVNSTKEMYKTTCNIVSELVANNERTLIFTKNDEISDKLLKEIGNEANVFKKDDISAYTAFVEDKCKVLIASEELGIGINLPNIQNIIHFGLPVSKNEYVQEIGRAGRADEDVKSFVIYLKVTEKNIPEVLLKRELEVPDIDEILKKMNNDYSYCYRKLNNDVNSQNELFEQVMDLYNSLESPKRALYVNTYDNKTVEKAKRYIYMLYVTGYVNDWYSYSGNEKEGTVDIMIDISSSNHTKFSKPKIMLKRMKERSLGYFESMDSDVAQIESTKKAKSAEDIIRIYVEWYYNKFLYNHKELFLDFLDFAERNKNSDNSKITEEIQEYFILPFAEIKNDEKYYMNLSISNIAEKIAKGISRRRLANISRLNSNNYSFNLDFILLLGTLKTDNKFDKNRFIRVINNADNEKVIEEVRQAFIKVYPTITDSAKLDFLYGAESEPILFGSNVEDVFTEIYDKVDKDLVFYGLVAEKLNNYFV